MKAIILVGGKGTRVQSESDSIPKCLIPLAGKPTLDYCIACCEASQHITQIILVTYHQAHQYQAYCQDKQTRVPIHCIQEQQPLGTAGALQSVPLSPDEEVLVLYGDIVCHFDVDRFIEYHHQKKGLATLLVHPNDHPYDSDLVIHDATYKVTSIVPKPHDDGQYYPNCVNAACYVMNARIKEKIPKQRPSDFGRDVWPNLCKTEAIFTYHTPAYLKDMGTPERMAQVEADIQSGKMQSCHESKKRPAVFLDRDGVINEERSFIKTPEELILYPGAGPAIKQLNKAGFLVVVVTNQSVIARNLCTEEILRQIHNKMDTELGKQGAYIDKLYYCPHHPDKGFPEELPMLKKDCQCRKPKPGMLLQATEALNIDLTQSYLVGDSERDIQAGIAAGVTTVGVRTGNGVKGETQPDILCDDIQAAVKMIIMNTRKEQKNGK